MKSVTNLVKVAVCMALLGLLATGCNVEREWISSRDPSEAEAQEEMQEQAAFYDIEKAALNWTRRPASTRST